MTPGWFPWSCYLSLPDARLLPLQAAAAATAEQIPTGSRLSVTGSRLSADGAPPRPPAEARPSPRDAPPSPPTAPPTAGAAEDGAAGEPRGFDDADKDDVSTEAASRQAKEAPVSLGDGGSGGVQGGWTGAPDGSVTVVAAEGPAGAAPVNFRAAPSPRAVPANPFCVPIVPGDQRP